MSELNPGAVVLLVGLVDTPRDDLADVLVAGRTTAEGHAYRVPVTVKADMLTLEAVTRNDEDAALVIVGLRAELEAARSWRGISSSIARLVRGWFK